MRRLKRLVLLVGALVILLGPSALAQTPPPGPLPGQVPEVQRPLPYWLSLPVLAGAAGLTLLVGVSYLFLQGRFYGKDEAPPVRQRPRFAGMAAAQPVAAAPQGAATATPGAAAAAKAAAPPAAAPIAPPQAAPAEKETPKPETGERGPADEPADQAPAERAAEEGPPEEPAPQTQAEAKSEQAAPPAPAAGPDQETFDRVLQEQIDKGVDRRVAEGRARAAAVKAAREKAGG